MINYLLVIVFTLLGALGAMFLKKSTGGEKFHHLVKSPCLYIGGIFYGAGALLNIYVLKTLRYTVVMPMTSMTYVWTMVLSYFILKEKITKRKIVGITLVLLGAILVALK